MTSQFFGNVPLTDAKRIRQLKDNLCGYLKSLNTGTANGENDPKPELQNIEVLKQLKASDTYRSKVLHQKRHDLITSPAKRSKKDANSSIVGLDTIDEIRDIDPDVGLTKKESRSRSTLAIESIATNSSTQTSLQEKFFAEQSEKHNLMRIAALEKQKESDLQLRLKQQALNKAALEVLIMKKQHNLLTDEEFQAQAKLLI